MRVMRLLGVVLVVVICAGCQSWRDRQMESRHDRYRATALAKIDQPACQAKGGHIRSFGMFGTPVCAVPFPDGGTPCSGKSDCAGKCLTDSSVLPVGTPSSGLCQRDDHLDGCWSEIVEGKINGGWCVD
jgi:hypothetical protein